MRRDEVMPYLGNIGQMFGLKVHDVLFAIELPFTLPVGQDPDDLGVVWQLIESIKRLGGNWVKIVKLVDDCALKSTNTPRTRTFLTTWEARLA